MKYTLARHNIEIAVDPKHPGMVFVHIHSNCGFHFCAALNVMEARELASALEQAADEAVANGVVLKENE
jgi:hypothetical protein